jgi:hypothetical protein
MEGSAAILLENGDLRSASWREDPIGDPWVISEIFEIRLSGMTMLDRADKGQWKEMRPTGREQYCEKFERRYVANSRPGMGFWRSLQRLRNKEGVYMDGIATGMPAPPRGPEWSL